MFRRFRWNEAEVMKQVMSGKEKALVALFEQNYLSARNYMLPDGASDDAIREVLEDAVIEYWQAVQTQKLRQPSDRFIMEALERLWKKRRPQQNGSSSTGAEEDLKAHEAKLQELSKFMKMHSDACRELLSLYYFEQWDEKSIAEKTGFRAEEIKERVFQCKRKLAQTVKRNISLRNLI
ncbi:MAG: hypothetical protein WD077_12560 [Bacteroidia bacterium]